ncbi:fructosamine kinase family protein [Aurantiacibacter zhengii]|uniref:Aminoglycoside phosphotransferase n=1 Tax=Aurantiacibacter zhengii TaxID=2307003 RepID=A0A418NRX9_9SPHN|nr:fructosamine kinase family protein [Aurantiacibacter zhengii]RIV85831.1 aminoglycoside phosphotransferase [Aurantiacibacter zhengii]
MSLAEEIEAALGEKVAATRQLPGGDLGGAALVTLADGREIVAKHGRLVAREGAMLRAIATTGAPVPQVLYIGGELLAMEFISVDGRAGWDSMAEGLRLLHTPQAGPYGWSTDYAFGSVTIQNDPLEDWPQFWAERRLLPFCEHISGALAARIENLARRTPDLLPQRPPAALLHGDLWSGNVLFNRGRLAALIDPASYYGDREVDFAMLQVFGSPPAAFFAASELPPGWRERVPVYQLWPMLVHLRLFGSGYRARVEDLLDACGV